MIIKIFTGPLNYDVKSLYEKDEIEYIIGVDQACKLLLDNDIPINLAIGDFDSLDEEYLDKIKKYAKTTKQFDSVKDYTDTFLALHEALSLPHEEIIIYGGLGDRFDHSYANINLLKLGNITIKNNDTEITILDPGYYYIENEYKYLSLFSIEDVLMLNLNGFKYELINKELLVDDPLCISNEGSGTLSFAEGKLLVIKQNEL